MTPLQAVKGMNDVLPEDIGRWHLVERAYARTMRLHGFREIRTPYLEPTALFVRAMGDTTDVVEKEMYSFEDRDGTSVTLRPEATASTVRAYLESGLAHRDPAARLFYRGPMFRRERPQKGRYRQFYQLGVEMLGRHDPLADAELLILVHRYLTLAGAARTELQLNSVGDAECRPGYREQLREFGRAHLAELCADCHRRLERNPLRIFDCKVESCRAVVAHAPLVLDSLCEPCRAHFDGVRALLDQEHVPYTINARLVRGLDYYVRTAFEIVAEGLGAQNAVGGGGRYDGLVAALGGPDISGVGFAIGMERLAMVVGDAEMDAAGPAAVILPLDDRAVPPALQLAMRLRDEALAVDVEPAGRSLKALLRAADRKHARLAVIIGDDELRSGRATVRDLARREDRPQALVLDAPGAALADAVRALAEAPA